MMSNFSMLDRKRGAFTILTILWHNYKPMTRRELIEEAERESIGRSAFYTAIDALRELGLILERDEILKGKRVVKTELTEKGFVVAEKFHEIHNLLDT